MTNIFSEDPGEQREIEIDLGLPDASTTDDLELNLDFGGLDAEDDDNLVIDLGDPEPEPEPEPVALDADDEAVLEELRAQLRSQVGDWYVIHTYSGMENRVKQNLDNRVKTLGMEDYIYEAVVPTEEVMETRNGARKSVTRTVLPG